MSDIRRHLVSDSRVQETAVVDVLNPLSDDPTHAPIRFVPRKCIQTMTGHEGGVAMVRLSSNGDYCLSCGYDRSVRLWNPVKGTLIKTYKGAHSFDVADVAVDPDNSKFVSVGGDRSAFLWDVATGRVIRQFRNHNKRVNCVAYGGESSSVIVTGSYDTLVRCWDARSGSADPIQAMNDAKDSITSVIVDAHVIISASVDGTIRHYDVRDGTLKCDEIRHPVTFLSLSHDAVCLLASCLDNKLRLLDRADGTLLAEFSGHRNCEFRLANAFSPDDSAVISGSEGGMIFVWDVVSKENVARLTGHKSHVFGVAQHPTAKVAVSGSQDGTVKAWSD